MTIEVEGEALQGKFSKFNEQPLKHYANGTIDWDDRKAYGGWEFYWLRVASLPKWLTATLCKCGSDDTKLATETRFTHRSEPVSSKETVYVAVCTACGLLHSLGDIHNWMEPEGCETCEVPFVNFPYDRYRECQSCRT